MAKRLVTQEMVCEAAEALMASGVPSPSVIQVRNHLGVGSFTTIRPLLSAWEDERKQAALATAEIPEELARRATEFVRRAWIIASAEANQSVEEAKAAAAEEIKHADALVMEANGEIRRLETVVCELQDRVERIEGALRTSELALAEARAIAGSVPHLESELVTVRQALERSQGETREAVVESARLHGRMEMLAKQLGAGDLSAS